MPISLSSFTPARRPLITRARLLRPSLISAFGIAWLLSGERAAAQDSARTREATRDSTADTVSCAGTVVRARELRRHPPAAVRSAPSWARGVVKQLIQHRTSRESAITPFLLLETGDDCTSFEVEESARLLRAQPYISDATVRAIPDGAGGVTLDVETEDEIPVVIDGRLRGATPTRIRYGSNNVFGSGIYGHLQWEQGFAFRDGWSARVTHFHAFRRPFIASVSAARRPLGEELTLSLGQPWLTEFQRHAFHTEVRHDIRYPEFIRPSGDPLSISVKRRFWSAGAVTRIGGRSAGTFGGVLFTHDRIEPAAEGIVVTDDGIEATDDPTLDARYARQEATRFGPVIGARALSYTQATGFDALEGTQDIARGIQAALFGGLGFGSGSDDMVSLDVYAGAGGARSFVGTRMEWQAERGGGEWRNLVGSGRLAWYLKASEERTLITSLELSAAWREDVPYQLLMRHRAGGLRGYGSSRLAGGQRLVLRGEHRWLLPGFRSFLGTGVAAFADVGRMWAGDVPFGRTVTRPSVGVSLLAAIPRDSRRLLRADLALPLVRGQGSGSYELRFQYTRPLRGFWQTPSDLSSARAAAPASRIFGWP